MMTSATPRLYGIADVDALGQERVVIRAGADSVAILGGLCRGNVGSNSRRLQKVAKEVR